MGRVFISTTTKTEENTLTFSSQNASLVYSEKFNVTFNILGFFFTFSKITHALGIQEILMLNQSYLLHTSRGLEPDYCHREHSLFRMICMLK